MTGLFQRLLGKKPAAGKPDGGAHQHLAWTGPQFRQLLTSHELSDVDLSKKVGHPTESVRRLRHHVHLFHRDGATTGLPDTIIRALKAEHEPWTCAVCKSAF